MGAPQPLASSTAGFSGLHVFGDVSSIQGTSGGHCLMSPSVSSPQVSRARCRSLLSPVGQPSVREAEGQAKGSPE